MNTQLKDFWGNFLGDFIRKSRVKSINNNIDKVQDAMFKLEADLILYDKDLAGFLRLPAKMSQYGGADGPSIRYSP